MHYSHVNSFFLVGQLEYFVVTHLIWHLSDLKYLCLLGWSLNCTETPYMEPGCCYFHRAESKLSPYVLKTVTGNPQVSSWLGWCISSLLLHPMMRRLPSSPLLKARQGSLGPLLELTTVRVVLITRPHVAKSQKRWLIPCHQGCQPVNSINLSHAYLILRQHVSLKVYLTYF